MSYALLQEQLLNYQRKLQKALIHLEYSYQKILTLPVDAILLDEEALETWESFAARFSRVADIFMTRYLRTIALIDDPAFNGSLRDVLNYAEKKAIIQKADDWLAIRELRNIAAHDYSETDLTGFFERLKNTAPILLSLKSSLVL